MMCGWSRWVSCVMYAFWAWGAPSHAQTLPSGLWVTYDDAGRKPQATLSISIEQGRMVGHIVDILDVRSDPDPRCENCPSDRKGLPLKGLRIITNMDPMPKNHVWSGGRILDPEEGREYKLELEWEPGAPTMKVRGFWGPFWRTQVWKRP